jgi:Tol biopolymer transport system component
LLFAPSPPPPTLNPSPVPERVGSDPSSGVAYAALGADGTLAFVPAAETNAERTLVLTDRTGKARTLPAPPRSYMYPRFSPDGKRIAVSIGPGHGNADDVWICEVETGALTRLTFGDGNGNYYPVWSPDGKRVAYTSDRGHQGIWFKNADGSGDEEPLQPDARPQLPQDWSRDGSRLAVNQGFPVSAIMTVSLGDRRETPFEPTAFAPTFSPDGEWITYGAQLAAGAPPQIFVRPLSGKAGKFQLSSEFGTFSVWTDREIVYLSENTKVVAVEAATKPTFRAGPPRELFKASYDRGNGPLRNYDVSRDGQTFVFVSGTSPRAWRHIHVMTDWSARLGKPGS